ncbi:MAG: ankyrin repeat domain-containing protein [Simkania sp.]|nr:ankyrin repeat domain-containing protein [Simkania sp.]
MSVLLNKQDVLKEMFPSVNQECYWHYIAKNTLKPSAYENPRLWESAEKIRQTFGSYCFDGREPLHGFTPLHVAAIQNNTAAVSFFLSQEASCEIQDANGNIPADYLDEGSPEQIKMLLRIHPVVRKIFPSWFTKHQTLLPQRSFEYHRGTHDFGVEIRRLRFSGAMNLQDPIVQETAKIAGIQMHFITHNMRSLAKKLGVEFVEAYTYYPLRDHWIRILDSSQKEHCVSFHAPKIELVDKAVDRAVSYSISRERATHALVAHQFCHLTLGFPANPNRQYIAAKDGLDPHNNLGFYFEGGNYFLTTNQKQEKHLFIGEELLYIILNQQRLEGFFGEPSEEWLARQKEVKELLSSQDVRNILEEMYYQGLLQPSPGMEKGLLPRESRGLIASLLEHSQTHGQRDKNLKHVAKDHDLITSFSPSDDQIENGRQVAAKYAMQKMAVKEQIAAKFSVPIEHIHFLPQVGYHLDTFMRPGPKGSFFVQDYELTNATIEEILANKEALKLSTKETQICANYLKVSRDFHRKLNFLLSEVEAVLKEAGFAVLKAPGVFYDVSPREQKVDRPMRLENDHLLPTHNVNFLNSVTGYSQTTGRFYYITSGAQLGKDNRLGTVLMQVFKEYLRNYVPNIDVCYIGKDPGKINDFSEGNAFWNKIGAQFGPHCLSVEEETQSHID